MTMPHELSDCSKDVIFVNTKFARLLQIVSQYIKEELAVTVGIDVPMSIMIKIVAKVWSVDKIAVLFSRGRLNRGASWSGRGKKAYVSKHDTIRAINVKWLCFRSLTRTGSRIPS